jgi:hypothetical protein
MKTNFRDEIVFPSIKVPPKSVTTTTYLSVVNASPRLFNGFVDETKTRVFYPIRLFLKGDLDDLLVTHFLIGSECVFNTADGYKIPAKAFAEGLEEPDLPMPFVMPDITVSLQFENTSEQDRIVSAKLLGIGVVGRVYRTIG